MPKHGVVVAGDALMDMQYFVEALPQKGGDERILKRRISTGGAAANTAYTLGLLGADTAFLGCMGQDDFADQISAQLNQAGVDTTLVQYDGETGYTVDLIDAGGERTMLSFRGASANAIELNHAVKTRLSHTAIFLISGYMLTDINQAQFVLEASAHVQACGGLVALDPCPVVDKVPNIALEEILSRTDILLPNADEYDILKKRAFNTLVRIPCIALKMGKNGARLTVKKEFVGPTGESFNDDITIDAVANPKQAMDTTGAGDAFNAGLIAAMLKSGEPAEWLALAVQTAERCIETPGAIFREI